MNLHNIKRLLERKCLSLPKNIKSQNKSVAMEIKLDRKKNHIAASDYKEQITVIKTTSDFKIGNNVDTNKIEVNYMVKREKERLLVYVSDEGEVVPRNLEENMEGFDLTIVYCLGCSWSGSPKKLVKR